MPQCPESTGLRRAPETSLSIKDAINQASMDRNSTEYVEGSVANSKERINNLTTQIEQLKGVAVTPTATN